MLSVLKNPFIIQSRQMAGQFMMHISSSFVIGIICAFPYAFGNFGGLFLLGLYTNEKRLQRELRFYVSFLFYRNYVWVFCSYSYFNNFYSNYQIDPSILNEFDIISYVSTISTLVLASGLVFQLPMVIYFLTKAGLVDKFILENIEDMQ